MTAAGNTVPADTGTLTLAALPRRNPPGLDAQARELKALRSLAQRVARLNPEAGEIGAGMLASLVHDARATIELGSGARLQGAAA